MLFLNEAHNTHVHILTHIHTHRTTAKFTIELEHTSLKVIRVVCEFVWSPCAGAYVCVCVCKWIFVCKWIYVLLCAQTSLSTRVTVSTYVRSPETSMNILTSMSNCHWLYTVVLTNLSADIQSVLFMYSSSCLCAIEFAPQAPSILFQSIEILQIATIKTWWSLWIKLRIY